VLGTVPLWFGLAEPGKGDLFLNVIGAPDHQSDWGPRIISNQDPLYGPTGYHFGSVWPLFTGWASVAEYRYHRAFPAYENLRSNALLATDGALGHFTEVLSGDYYQSFATSSPHQIWSAAMVLSPILRGMFGLETDAEKHEITLAPHVPADWTSFTVRNVHVGGVSVEAQFRKTVDSLALEVRRTGTGDCWIQFSPALSLRTEVASVEMNGRPVPFKVKPNTNDQHVTVRFQVHGGPNNLLIRVKNDFGLAVTNGLPPLGSASRSLRVLSESWNAARTQLALEVSGLAGSRYELAVWNANQVSSVEGSLMSNAGKLQVQMPGAESEAYAQQKVVLHFSHP